MTAEDQAIGIVVGGSLSRGVQVRLLGNLPVETMNMGSFVTIQAPSHRFFGIITDVSLELSDGSLRAAPPDTSNAFIASVMAGTGAYVIVEVLPQLRIGNDAFSMLDGPQPARSMPGHFSKVYSASEEDIRVVFGTEDEQHMWIGNPVDMENTRIHLDLDELVKRSNGVFGKSGTGKSFLTRILLAGIIQKQTAVNLIFDMHNDYGWQGSSERGSPVKGLKQIFPSSTAVFTLDGESSRRRGLTPDAEVQIGFDQIEPQDIETLQETLNLTPQGVGCVYSLVRLYGQKEWLSQFLAKESREDLAHLAESTGELFQVLFTLRRRMRVFSRMPFVVDYAVDDAVTRILDYLERGVHVVLEFGRHGNDVASYILVANLLTRRIHERYVDLMERAAGSSAEEPRQLVITIEEAHRFLTPTIASQTIFGTIAREMRKFKVSLLVVDQRPSGIDEEVVSQFGTRFSYLLDNDKDVEAVLSGAPGARELRSVMARLDSQQQCLMFGHALPMPVVVKTRDYGTEESYREFGIKGADELRLQALEDTKDLFG